jgi:hypothetical protein
MDIEFTAQITKDDKYMLTIQELGRHQGGSAMWAGKDVNFPDCVAWIWEKKLGRELILNSCYAKLALYLDSESDRRDAYGRARKWLISLSVPDEQIIALEELHWESTPR